MDWPFFSFINDITGYVFNILVCGNGNNDISNGDSCRSSSQETGNNSILNKLEIDRNPWQGGKIGTGSTDLNKN